MGALVDLLVPPRCAACVAPARGWCTGCAGDAERLRLGPDIWAPLAEGVAAIGVFAYGGVVRDAVRGMKVQGRFAAARWLGREIAAHPAMPHGWPLTWVPSTRARLRQRGVEIPRLLAGPSATALLRRTVERPDQTTLSSAQRRVSPVGAFAAASSVPRQVVLIDDVRTTGATALAAAQALVDGGAGQVLVATLAVGGDDARRTPDGDQALLGG